MKRLLALLLSALPLSAQTDPSDPAIFDLEATMDKIQHDVWPLITTGEEATACEIVMEWENLTFDEWLVSNFPRVTSIPSSFTCLWGASVTGPNGLTQYGEPEAMWGVIEYMGLDWQVEFQRAKNSFNNFRNIAANRAMDTDKNLIRQVWSQNSYAQDWNLNDTNQSSHDLLALYAQYPAPWWLGMLQRANELLDPDRSVFTSLELAYITVLDRGTTEGGYGNTPYITMGNLTAQTANAWNGNKARVGDPAQPFGLSADAAVWNDGSVPFILGRALENLRACTP